MAGDGSPDVVARAVPVPGAAALDAYREVERARDESAAWRLLRASGAPLVISFVRRVFVDGGARRVPADELAETLDEHLATVNAAFETPRHPRSARAYLEDWAAPGAGWLRKFYSAGDGEARYDTTPAALAAVAWVDRLAPRDFVGLGAPFAALTEQLRQIADGTDDDRETLLANLRAKRDRIDAQIDDVVAGRLHTLDDDAVRDHYDLARRLASDLLLDLRSAEDALRGADRAIRERAAAGARDAAAHQTADPLSRSAQGLALSAFADDLLSFHRQEELAGLISAAQLAAADYADPRLGSLQHDLLAAAEAATRSARELSDQLRRFLVEQSAGEDRRVRQLLSSIKSSALALRDRDVSGFAASLPGARADISLPMERPLYRKPARAEVVSEGVAAAEEDVDPETLFSQVHVDVDRLAQAVRLELARSDQTTLPRVLAAHPLELGLAELVSYLALSDPAFDVVIDENERERVDLGDGGRAAEAPVVTFARRDPTSRPRPSPVAQQGGR